MVACLGFLLINPPCCPSKLTYYRQLLSSIPVWWTMLGFHVCLLSKDIGIMIASLHICGSVRNDQLWLYIFRILIMLNCPRVSTFRLWLHLVLETSCCCTGRLLLVHRVVSDTFSCDPSCHFLSLPFSLYLSCFLLIFYIDWDVTNIF